MPKTLLIVDDDASLCKATEDFFKLMAPHIKVISSPSAVDALDIIRTRTVNCVLSDFMMPSMNGIELLKTVRGEGYVMPFIIITGHPVEMVEPLAQEIGVNGCYQKNGSLGFYDQIITMMST